MRQESRQHFGGRLQLGYELFADLRVLFVPVARADRFGARFDVLRVVFQVGEQLFSPLLYRFGMGRVLQRKGDYVHRLEAEDQGGGGRRGVARRYYGKALPQHVQKINLIPKRAAAGIDPRQMVNQVAGRNYVFYRRVRVVSNLHQRFAPQRYGRKIGPCPRVAGKQATDGTDAAPWQQVAVGPLAVGKLPSKILQNVRVAAPS